jgi:hypothetical protein
MKEDTPGYCRAMLFRNFRRATFAKGLLTSATGHRGVHACEWFLGMQRLPPCPLFRSLGEHWGSSLGQLWDNNMSAHLRGRVLIMQLGVPLPSAVLPFLLHNRHRDKTEAILAIDQIMISSAPRKLHLRQSRSRAGSRRTRPCGYFADSGRRRRCSLFEYSTPTLLLSSPTFKIWHVRPISPLSPASNIGAQGEPTLTTVEVQHGVSPHDHLKNNE